MSRRRGKRYDDTPRINSKKILASIIAIIVVIMMIYSLKILLIDNEKPKDVSTLTTYQVAYDNEKWGVIDNKGSIVIKAEYDEMIMIPDKNKDLFICSYDVDYGNESYKTKVINKKGNEILKEYENVEPIENTDGMEVWYESNVLKYKKDGKIGLINFDGKKILEAEYDDIYAMPGIERSIIIEKDGKKGLVNTSLGEIIIPVEYVEISSLTDTYENGYIVKNSENKSGVIGADKTKILDTKFDEIRNVYSNNYYVVVQNGTMQIIDNQEKVILDEGFDSIEEIAVDNFIIIKNNKYGIISKDGKEIIPAEYENLKFAFSNCYIAQKNGKYGIIDNDENTKIDFKYDSISYIKTADFFECEREDYKTDILDRNLNTTLENVIISELNIENGYLRVRENSDYKYYNFKFEEKTNKEMLPTNTLFLIKENGKFGYENKNGDRVVDCIYDDAKEQNEFGYCAVKKDGLWGSLKSDGTVVVKPSVNLDEYLYIDFIADWYRYNDLSLNIYTK